MEIDVQKPIPIIVTPTTEKELTTETSAEQNIIIAEGEEVVFESNSYIPIHEGGVTPYSGDYVFTPTQYQQTVPVKDKLARANIVINPIPSNYGLVTWNGSTLTVE